MTPRRNRFLALGPRTDKYFFSYQGDRGEILEPDSVGDCSVVFWDRYQPLGFVDSWGETLCPLNTHEDITGVCEGCRRCFNGDAVKYRHKPHN